jgi:GT2 family glycosyltransferase
MNGWDRRSARDVDVVSGMYMLVRREAIDDVGPMDDAYFVYAEEADWCFRIWKAGWRCHFTPTARIVHHEGGGKSTSKVHAKMYVQMQKSLLIFLRKNRGWASWLLGKAMFVFWMATRAVAWRVRAAVSEGDAIVNARCALAALRFHLLGVWPTQ